jgi:hypothetical protein
MPLAVRQIIHMLRHLLIADGWVTGEAARLCSGGHSVLPGSAATANPETFAAIAARADTTPSALLVGLSFRIRRCRMCSSPWPKDATSLPTS